MRFAGIDVGSRTHVLAIVDEDGQLLVKPTEFGENAAGYATLLELLGVPDDVLIAIEATGCYGRNLFEALCAHEYQVALLNPLRTRRFAEEDLRRTKTDSIDATGIARFAAQKRPLSTPPFDEPTLQLREYVRLYDRLTQDYGDRRRQLHRLIQLCFPEFTQLVRSLTSHRASTILQMYPTAKSFTARCVRKLAATRCAGRAVGPRLARNIVDAAIVSVGRHHGPAYETHMRFVCADIERLRSSLAETTSELQRRIDTHPVGQLLATIDGLGTTAVARIIAAVGDPARFRDSSAFTAYAGVVPGTRDSGLRRGGSAPLCPLGNARLRRALYMTTLSAVRRNPWLRAYYERLVAKGKPPKVALLAAMRKLITAVYSVAKNRQPFVPRLDK